MSKFKVGDKMRVVKTGNGINEGETYIVTGYNDYGNVTVEGFGKTGFFEERFELVKEAPKGTFEQLYIQSHPQGGYTVTAVNSVFGSLNPTLAAFTTAEEAISFVGRNIK